MLKSIFVKQGKDVKCSNKAPCHNSTKLGMLCYDSQFETTMLLLMKSMGYV